MPRVGSLAGRSLANTASKRIYGNFPFSFTNISSSVTTAQLGGTTTRSTAISNSYSLSGSNLTYSVTGLPFHSYGNANAANTPAATNLTGTWVWRGGTNTPQTPTKTTVGNGLIGHWINGVAMFNNSAAAGSPAGYTSPGAEWNYNASFENGEDLGYTFGEDLAGGHAAPPNQYHYHDGTFFNAWTSGSGNTPGLTAGSTGLAEASAIPYLQSGLFHADGHSKILGISKDGYPVYGPYGYVTATNSASGIKRMTSGYSLKSPSTRTATTASNLTTYPMGIFVQDYSYTGTDTTRNAYTATANGASSIQLVRSWESGGVAATADLGNNPTITAPVGSTITFNVSLTGHPLYIKTVAGIGTGNQVSTGYVTGQGATSGAVVWHTGGVTPGTYYYQCSAHASMNGIITITAASTSDLDTYNGRYCYTPDYPAGTYAYFITLDPDLGPAFPYVIGTNYYGTPAV